MTNLLQFLRSARSARFFEPHSYAGNTYWGVPTQAWTPSQEGIGSDFVSLVQAGYQSNGVIFACELTRTMLFSEARFQWRRLNNGRPGDLFGSRDLDILENPWPGGTTGDLLTVMLLDADFAGSAFIARPREMPDRLMRLRPDWVTMVLGSQQEPDDANIAMDAEFLGIIYHPGGIMSGRGTSQVLLADEVAHFAPTRDPLATHRGQSWLTPIVREMQADAAATLHKLMFFENGGSPQMVVSMGENVSPDTLQQFVAKMEDSHTGAHNAYRTLYLGGGAQVNVVGKDLRQLDFKATQGAGESRIASAAGVHPVIAGLSEGLAGSSLNAGNFQAAARLVADRTLRPLWRSVAGSLQAICPPPAGAPAQLWYDDRDISFLQENRKDAADIQAIQATAIRTLVDANFKPDTVVKAVAAEDMTLLEHTGIPTVQSQHPAAALPKTNGSQNGSPNGKALLIPGQEG